MRSIINAMLRVARISLVDDSGPIQRVQIDEGSLGAYGGRRLIDRVAHVMHFGFTSVAPIGSEAMLAAPAGDRGQTIAVGTNHQPSRPRDLGDGDACLYDARGRRMWLSDEGILVDGAGGPVTVRNASKVRCECTVEATGDIVGFVDGAAISLKALHDAYAAHAHGGVKAGTDTSGQTTKPV